MAASRAKNALTRACSSLQRTQSGGVREAGGWQAAEDKRESGESSQTVLQFKSAELGTLCFKLVFLMSLYNLILQHLIKCFQIFKVLLIHNHHRKSNFCYIKFYFEIQNISFVFTLPNLFFTMCENYLIQREFSVKTNWSPAFVFYVWDDFSKEKWSYCMLSS